jgi:hypothetical protein
VALGVIAAREVDPRVGARPECPPRRAARTVLAGRERRRREAPVDARERARHPRRAVERVARRRQREVGHGPFGPAKPGLRVVGRVQVEVEVDRRARVPAELDPQPRSADVHHEDALLRGVVARRPKRDGVVTREQRREHGILRVRPREGERGPPEEFVAGSAAYGPLPPPRAAGEERPAGQRVRAQRPPIGHPRITRPGTGEVIVAAERLVDAAVAVVVEPVADLGGRSERVLARAPPSGLPSAHAAVRSDTAAPDAVLPRGAVGAGLDGAWDAGALEVDEAVAVVVDPVVADLERPAPRPGRGACRRVGARKTGHDVDRRSIEALDVATRARVRPPPRDEGPRSDVAARAGDHRDDRTRAQG